MPRGTEAVGWGPAALALEDPENATEHKNQASTMTPVSGVIFSISIALGVHLTTFIQIFPGFLPHGRISPGYMVSGKAQKEN